MRQSRRGHRRQVLHAARAALGEGLVLAAIRCRHRCIVGGEIAHVQLVEDAVLGRRQRRYHLPVPPDGLHRGAAQVCHHGGLAVGVQRDGIRVGRRVGLHRCAVGACEHLHVVAVVRAVGPGLVAGDAPDAGGRVLAHRHARAADDVELDRLGRRCPQPERRRAVAGEAHAERLHSCLRGIHRVEHPLDLQMGAAARQAIDEIDDHDLALQQALHRGLRRAGHGERRRARELWVLRRQARADAGRRRQVEGPVGAAHTCRRVDRDATVGRVVQLELARRARVGPRDRRGVEPHRLGARDADRIGRGQARIDGAVTGLQPDLLPLGRDVAVEGPVRSHSPSFTVSLLFVPLFNRKSSLPLPGSTAMST